MGNKAGNAVSQADYAKLRDVSRKTVTKWKGRGLIVMAGDLVDVEQSDAMLKRYRRQGLPNAGDDTETPESLLSRLHGMDWNTDFSWSEKERVKRATKAAECIGLRVVTSDNPIGDGQWGGYQLRHVEREKREGLDMLTIWAGHGYELCVIGVLDYCRDAAEHDPGLIKRPDLLHALARPFGPGDTPEV